MHVQRSSIIGLTCSWTQPSTHRHLSVTEYWAYDMFVVASKHHAVLCSVPIVLPLQKSGHIALGPLEYPGLFCYECVRFQLPSVDLAGRDGAHLIN